MNNRLLIGVAAAALAVCATAAWFLQKDAPPSPVISVAPAPLPTPPLEVPPEPIPTDPVPTAATAPGLKQEPEKPPADSGMTAWEMKIDQALNANVGEAETAQILINMLPSLPAEGQADAAQHISNLVLDDDYARVMPLLRNANLPEEVLDVFVTDLMNREDAVKLPALLEVAKIPNHPHHEEAQADLEIFLDQEHGTDWAKWDAAVKKYLQDQAKEAAEGAAGTPLDAPPPPRVSR
jgi:hypothetical protein